jgi:hypothetical protein
MSSKVYVYVASPYTKGDVAVNVKDSLFIADYLLELGIVPFVPLLSHFWHFLSPKSYETWFELDLAWILKCDALYRVAGESDGADKEVLFAIENKIPVFYGINTLGVWANEQKEKKQRIPEA